LVPAVAVIGFIGGNFFGVGGNILVYFYIYERLGTDSQR
jgi:hypothetical protein